MIAIIFIILGWIGGASAMWIYLRFSGLIRNHEEHRNALAYHPKDSHGLVGAIYKVDATGFKKFVKSYFKDMPRRR